MSFPSAPPCIQSLPQMGTQGPLSLSAPHPCAYPNSVAQENTLLGIVTLAPTSKAKGVQALQEIAQLCSDKNPAATFRAGGRKPHLPHLE